MSEQEGAADSLAEQLAQAIADRDWWLCYMLDGQSDHDHETLQERLL